MAKVFDKEITHTLEHPLNIPFAIETWKGLKKKSRLTILKFNIKK